MKLLHWPFVCAFALTSIPSLAPADEPTIAERAQARVENGLVKPLAERENNRFSRARPAPRERRVRITSSTLSSDKSGRPFLPFAIDVKFGSDWRENDIVSARPNRADRSQMLCAVAKRHYGSVRQHRGRL